MAESPVFIEWSGFEFALYVHDFLKWPLFNCFDRRVQHSMRVPEVAEAAEAAEPAEQGAVGGAHERVEDHEIDQITEINDSLSLYDEKNRKTYNVWASLVK